jgi:hypothetical protein
MAPFIAIILMISLTMALGLLAISWGADSRPSMGDDHAR